MGLKLQAFTFLLILLFMSTAHAGLQWEHRTFTHTATPDQEKVTAEFPFINTGNRTVTITKVKSSCGCSTPKLEKRVYAPGEEGRLQVIFTVGRRTGMQHKTVLVNTDDPDDPRYLLKLEIDIPVPVRVWPKFLYWGPNDPTTPKTLTVAFDHNQPVRITGVRPSHPMISASVQAAEPGKRYTLTLTPDLDKGTTRELIPITIESDLPYQRLRTVTVYARVAIKSGDAQSHADPHGVHRKPFLAAGLVAHSAVRHPSHSHPQPQRTQ